MWIYKFCFKAVGQVFYVKTVFCSSWAIEFFELWRQRSFWYIVVDIIICTYVCKAAYFCHKESLLRIISTHFRITNKVKLNLNLKFTILYKLKELNFSRIIFKTFYYILFFKQRIFSDLENFSWWFFKSFSKFLIFALGSKPLGAKFHEYGFKIAMMRDKCSFFLPLWYLSE